ncbi:cytochrome P450 [Aspergillus luchuensis]|uniref:Uncharacterized protein n=1 Tax=Aspergillus kawachii TaxID=1069201 RepID=A0A7R7WIV9_ASPKA|nr:uncharacterized protein AKAW2_70529S [Aspergillus luchuensis]BCS03651.1 hypothetical protein AKAW2_70529S [Aspergillus luchuensis]BCS15271.1 hypothetical protein ALUC_70504S [Aspergillus luchuensis]
MFVYAWLGIALLTYHAFRSIYRLCFHPLRKIPGPKLAAITYGYEFYYNVIKGGKFVWEIERMHKIYGPIIRINPDEVHINDPDYYEEIYTSRARRREKDPFQVAQFDIDGAAFSSITPEIHRQRRAPLDRFFSKQAISNIEYLIYDSLDKVIKAYKEAFQSKSVVSLDAGFAGLTADIIHQYAFGFNPGNLDVEGFNESVRDAANAVLQGMHLLNFFPFIKVVFGLLPHGLLRLINEPAVKLAEEKEDLLARSAAALERNQTPVKEDEKISNSKGAILDAIAAPRMPEHMRTPKRLMEEGLSLAIAGTETTARALSVGTYHLLTKEHVRLKLKEELKTVMPTPDMRVSRTELEKLPYLSGVINESMRLATGVSSRMTRIAPTEALVYKEHVIPPGSLFSSSNVFILMNPNIFPNPHDFDPERWIRAAEKGERLDRYLVNFSKGARICLGMQLAIAELFIVIASLMRQFDMELVDTPKETIEFARDFGAPYPEKGNLFIKARITGLAQE